MMQQTCLTTLTFLFAIGLAAQDAAQADPPARPLHLFILSGQSNMEKLDPQISFTPTVTEGLKDSDVLVVKDAEGGQPMRRWYKDWKAPAGVHVQAMGTPGDLYVRLMTKVHKALEGKPRPKTITFIWMQGERDAKEGGSSVYGKSLQGLLAQLRKDLDRPDMYFVIGRLNDHNPDAQWKAIREAQVSVAQSDPRGAWIDTDDLNGSRNGVHLTKEGYREAGRRYAQKALALINGEPRK